MSEIPRLEPPDGVSSSNRERAARHPRSTFGTRYEPGTEHCLFRPPPRVVVRARHAVTTLHHETRPRVGHERAHRGVVANEQIRNDAAPTSRLLDCSDDDESTKRASWISHCANAPISTRLLTPTPANIRRIPHTNAPRKARRIPCELVDVVARCSEILHCEMWSVTAQYRPTNP